ncbi:Threonine endopeptidase [Zea mays]|uniref:Threonine endopeptidase n=1 Tax=Zea mays TaxID=4577 RepID=A0A1D6KPF0_MAIZE|nr:Threonine endopeptidase [Zea mays]
MVAAAAAVRPVSFRRLGVLLRAPLPCGLTTSRVAAPFPRRTGTEWLLSFDVPLKRSYASKFDMGPAVAPMLFRLWYSANCTWHFWLMSEYLK